MSTISTLLRSSGMTHGMMLRAIANTYEHLKMCFVTRRTIILWCSAIRMKSHVHTLLLLLVCTSSALGKSPTAYRVCKGCSTWAQHHLHIPVRGAFGV